MYTIHFSKKTSFGFLKMNPFWASKKSGEMNFYTSICERQGKNLQVWVKNSLLETESSVNMISKIGDLHLANTWWFRFVAWAEF